MTKKTKERFWSKVQKGPGCWVWTASCYANGYGKFEVKGSILYAHRVSYAMKHDIPKGLCVLHECDNRKCVRPSHLWLGTHADNTADMMNKGRQVAGVSHGTQNGRAKLTEAQVKVIRRDSRTFYVIAKDYGVCSSTIGYIKQRKTWKHVKE